MPTKKTKKAAPKTRAAVVDPDRRFRVVGIAHSNNLPLFASKLEEAMNSLTELGFDIQVHHTDKGALVLGAKAPQAVPPPAILAMFGLGGPPSSGATPFSPAAKELIGRATRLVDLDTKNLEEEFPKHIQEITKGMNVEQLRSVSKELAEDAVSHEKNHQDPDCPVPNYLRALSKAIDGSMRLHLQ